MVTRGWVPRLLKKGVGRGGQSARSPCGGGPPGAGLPCCRRPSARAAGPAPPGGCPGTAAARRGGPAWRRAPWSLQSKPEPVSRPLPAPPHPPRDGALLFPGKDGEAWAAALRAADQGSPTPGPWTAPVGGRWGAGQRARLRLRLQQVPGASVTASAPPQTLRRQVPVAAPGPGAAKVGDRWSRQSAGDGASTVPAAASHPCGNHRPVTGQHRALPLPGMGPSPRESVRPCCRGAPCAGREAALRPAGPGRGAGQTLREQSLLVGPSFRKMRLWSRPAKARAGLTPEKRPPQVFRKRSTETPPCALRPCSAANPLPPRSHREAQPPPRLHTGR